MTENQTRAPAQTLTETGASVEDFEGLFSTPSENCSTSLVNNRHIAVRRLSTPGEAFSGSRCERVDFDLKNTVTKERISGRCKAYFCSFCGPPKLRLLEFCLVASRPERFVTLTLAPEDPKQRRDHVANLKRSLKKTGYKTELAWCTEPNPKGTGHHIHALQKGDYIPQSVLQKKWGGRIAHIEKLKSVSGGVGRYMLKQEAAVVRAAGYALKHQQERARPVNITRDYFGGRRLEEVRSDVRNLLYDDDEKPPSSWVRVPRC